MQKIKFLSKNTIKIANTTYQGYLIGDLPNSFGFIYNENKARAEVTTSLNIVPTAMALLPLAAVDLCSPSKAPVASPSCQRVCGRPILRQVLVRPAVTEFLLSPTHSQRFWINQLSS